MKLTTKLVLLLAAALGLAASSAKADAFGFSYTFGDGLIVSGSLDGMLNGNFVENVSNVSVLFNGIAMPGGGVTTGSYDGADFGDGPAIVSFDVLSNNFLFRSSDPDFFAGFYIVNETVFSSNTATAYSFTDDLFLISTEDTSPRGIWSLKAATVPDQGATIILFAFGLVLLAWFRAQACSAAVRG